METNENKMEVIDSSTALSAYTRAEIDMQIATAKQYPRDIKASLARIEALVLSSPEIAQSCMYSLPRADKLIEGKSIRLAEIVAQSWGNLRIATKVTGIDATHITAEGVVHDLETNVAIRSERKAKITNKYGQRFNDDMIATTANALCSKAMRDAVFDCVPEALIKDVVDKAKAMARGELTTDKSKLADARIKAIQMFKALGKTDAEIFTFLGHNEITDISADDVMLLRGVYTAIKDGELTAENCFAIDEQKGKELADNAALKAKLKKQK